MKTVTTVEVQPHSVIRAGLNAAFTQVKIDDLTINVAGYSWPNVNEYHERIAILDALAAAIAEARRLCEEQLGPVEKSPLTGFTPEWRPWTIWMSTPSSIDAMSSAGDRSPGTSCIAIQPQPGVPRKPPRTALPVEAVPARRAEYDECTN